MVAHDDRTTADSGSADDFWDQVVDGAFGHGYAVQRHREAREPSMLDGWPRHRVGELSYAAHPRAVFTQETSSTLAGSHRSIVLIGHPLDVSAGISDPAIIARRLLATMTNHGPDATVHEAAYLGGRWTLFIQDEQDDQARCWVVPDAHATQAVFYSTRSGFALASSATLVAEMLGIAPSEAVATMHQQIKTLRPRGTTFLPGLLTDYDDVLPLVPNCLLDIDLQPALTVRHRRFWPFERRVGNRDFEDVYQRFRERFSAHTALMGDFGLTCMSLTGGLDSRISLAHVLPHEFPGFFAFTYYNPVGGLGSPESLNDMLTANELAFRVGIRHRVLRWRQADRDGVFAHIHRRTYPTSHVSHGAAHAMWRDLPHELVEIQSIGAETGTIFARARTEQPISPARLATLWMGPKFADRQPYLDLFERYLAYADFTRGALQGYNYHDLNYWEHRVGKWGYRKFQDGDAGHRVLSPFNDRGLIEIMLSLPEPQRIAKDLFTRTLQDHPHLQPSRSSGAVVV